MPQHHVPPARSAPGAMPHAAPEAQAPAGHVPQGEYRVPMPQARSASQVGGIPDGTPRAAAAEGYGLPDDLCRLPDQIKAQLSFLRQNGTGLGDLRQLAFAIMAEFMVQTNRDMPQGGPAPVYHIGTPARGGQSAPAETGRADQSYPKSLTHINSDDGFLRRPPPFVPDQRSVLRERDLNRDGAYQMPQTSGSNFVNPHVNSDYRSDPNGQRHQTNPPTTNMGRSDGFNPPRGPSRQTGELGGGDGNFQSQRFDAGYGATRLQEPRSPRPYQFAGQGRSDMPQAGAPNSDQRSGRYAAGNMTGPAGFRADGDLTMPAGVPTHSVGGDRYVNQGRTTELPEFLTSGVPVRANDPGYYQHRAPQGGNPPPISVHSSNVDDRRNPPYRYDHRVGDRVRVDDNGVDDGDPIDQTDPPREYPLDLSGYRVYPGKRGSPIEKVLRDLTMRLGKVALWTRSSSVHLAEHLRTVLKELRLFKLDHHVMIHFIRGTLATELQEVLEDRVPDHQIRGMTIHQFFNVLWKAVYPNRRETETKTYAEIFDFKRTDQDPEIYVIQLKSKYKLLRNTVPHDLGWDKDGLLVNLFTHGVNNRDLMEYIHKWDRNIRDIEVLHALVVEWMQCKQLTRQKKPTVAYFSKDDQGSPTEGLDDVIDAIQHDLDDACDSDEEAQVLQGWDEYDSALLGAVLTKRPEWHKTAKCHNCGRIGHLKRDCRQPIKNGEMSKSFCKICKSVHELGKCQKTNGNDTGTGAETKVKGILKKPYKGTPKFDKRKFAPKKFKPARAMAAEEGDNASDGESPRSDSDTESSFAVQLALSVECQELRTTDEEIYTSSTGNQRLPYPSNVPTGSLILDTGATSACFTRRWAVENNIKGIVRPLDRSIGVKTANGKATAYYSMDTVLEIPSQPKRSLYAMRCIVLESDTVLPLLVGAAVIDKIGKSYDINSSRMHLVNGQSVQWEKTQSGLRYLPIKQPRDDLAKRVLSRAGLDTKSYGKMPSKPEPSAYLMSAGGQGLEIYTSSKDVNLSDSEAELSSEDEPTESTNSEINVNLNSGESRLLTSDFVKTMVKQLHVELLHLGANGTYKKMQHIMTFKGMKQLIKNVLEQCPDCPELNPRHGDATIPFADLSKLSKGPNDIVAFDTLYLGDSQDGPKYVLVMVDIATRYCVIAAIDNQDSESVLNAYATRWRGTLGEAKQFYVDGGKEFKGCLQDYASERAIPVHTSATGSPSSNGIVERKNREIIKGVLAEMKRRNITKDLWPQAIPTVQDALNLRPNKGQTVSPIELMRPTSSHEGRTPSLMTLEAAVREGDETHNVLPPPRYETGETVLYRHPLDKFEKLESSWRTYTVARQVSPYVYQLMPKGESTHKSWYRVLGHVKYMRKYRDPDTEANVEGDKGDAKGDTQVDDIAKSDDEDEYIPPPLTIDDLRLGELVVWRNDAKGWKGISIGEVTALDTDENLVEIQQYGHPNNVSKELKDKIFQPGWVVKKLPFYAKVPPYAKKNTKWWFITSFENVLCRDVELTDDDRLPPEVVRAYENGVDGEVWADIAEAITLKWRLGQQDVFAAKETTHVNVRYNQMSPEGRAAQDAARTKELDKWMKHQVYKTVSAKAATSRPIPVQWIDTIKLKDGVRVAKSRLVVRGDWILEATSTPRPAHVSNGQ